ncbi:MAG: glycosyltransferase [Pseudomonadota bacterium]
MLFALALVSLAVWIGLLFAHGGFWRCDQRLTPAPAPMNWPRVAVVIPARDEAETIRDVVASHMASDYPGQLDVFLVDDGSTDGTAEAAGAGATTGARPFHLVAAPPLETGWSGKLWALNAGLSAAKDAAPDADYLLLTDADILHGPSLLQGLVARAEKKTLALVSVMARLDGRGFWGGLLIPAFIFFFQKLYPFPRVNDLGSRTAGAAGGVVLLRRDALDEIGGIDAIRGALIDDCALAAKVKRGPPARAIELVLSDEAARATSLRDNRAFASIRKMIARTAFTQLDHSAWKLAGAVAGMVLVYLVGPAALLTWPLHGNDAAALAGFGAWLAMMIAYAPTLRLYDRPALNGVALPFAALLYTAFTVDSALQHWRGEGGEWKGRTYPAS